MFHWLCSRRQFVDFFADQKPLNSHDVQWIDSIEDVFVQGEDIILVWQKSPSERFVLPSAVIVAEGGVPDFIAWISTYFKHLRPFTAQCRVLTPSLARLAEQAHQSPPMHDVKSADIGLILAEVIAYSASRTDVKKLPLSAYVRTLSFAFAKGLKHYNQVYRDQEGVFSQIEKGWLSARKCLQQQSLGLSSGRISDVWEIVRCAVSPRESQSNSVVNRLLLDALQGVLIDGRVPRSIWTKLYGRSKKIVALFEVLEGPREDRVKAVEVEVKSLVNGLEKNREHQAFLLGYLVSRIQPGSLDHFSLLFPVLSTCPESLLWYGACAGLTPETSVANYGSGLGWLLKREIERPVHWLSSPTCDIALTEMEVLLRNRDSAKFDLRTLTTGVLNVEVFPLISANFKWYEYGHVQGSDRSPHQSEMFEDDARTRKELGEMLRRIDESAMNLNAIRSQVMKTFGGKKN